MAMIKKYLLDLLAHCSEHPFGQDAVEWAITSGFVKLTYDLDQDLRTIMGEPGRPETGQYSQIIEAYQRVIHDQIMESDLAVLEEMRRAA